MNRLTKISLILLITNTVIANNTFKPKEYFQNKKVSSYKILMDLDSKCALDKEKVNFKDFDTVHGFITRIKCDQFNTYYFIPKKIKVKKDTLHVPPDLNGIFYHKNSKECVSVKHADITESIDIFIDSVSKIECPKYVYDAIAEEYAITDSFESFSSSFMKCLESNEEKCIRSFVKRDLKDMYFATGGALRVPFIDREHVIQHLLTNADIKKQIRSEIEKKIVYQKNGKYNITSGFTITFNLILNNEKVNYVLRIRKVKYKGTYTWLIIDAWSEEA